jgi:phosphoribosylformimino-5-aminoimidazole carboxamide ribotide isomerase
VRIIPVLDLKDGMVVRAAGGRRDEYSPIRTPLSPSADIVAIASGFRSLYPFETFYVADLDAIAGLAANEAALARLARLEEPPRIWLDAGFREARGLESALGRPSLSPVLGSESQDDDALLRRFHDHPGLILSLDFFADAFRGPASLLEEPGLWPQRVIVMTLARVGSAAGPDLARLEKIMAKAGGREIVAAGGVRGEADLRALSGLGVSAALVATSLHDGTLDRAALARLCSR